MKKEKRKAGRKKETGKERDREQPSHLPDVAHEAGLVNSYTVYNLSSTARLCSVVPGPDPPTSPNPGLPAPAVQVR